MKINTFDDIRVGTCHHKLPWLDYGNDFYKFKVDVEFMTRKKIDWKVESINMETVKFYLPLLKELNVRISPQTRVVMEQIEKLEIFDIVGD